MLYNLKWLEAGQKFPPACELDRINRYYQNAQLFDGDHFADPVFRTYGHCVVPAIEEYKRCASRISQVIGNFEDVVSFPTLLNYQRLMTLKMADLVCGEHPTISGATPKENAALRDVRDTSDFDAKLYATIIDLSRYGDAVWRVYKDYDGNYNFTSWDPGQWFPIIRQDGTNSIEAHCLAWLENRSEDPKKPEWFMVAQIHSCKPKEIGYYIQKEFRMDSTGHTIMEEVSSTKVMTGLDRCGVFHLKAFSVTNTVYGYDDYLPLDSLVAEIMARVGQISSILDKHADPNITGPASMLEIDPQTGEYVLKAGKFYAVSPGEEQPKYMTWDGQLTSAFRQLELLINQLYILSEMGAALLGGQDGSSQAVSGAAMRFKMVNPLAKARRISNALTRPVRQLLSCLSVSAEIEESDFTESEDLQLPIPYRKVSVFWADGLPDDPRENIENAKLATGETKMMPLETAIMEFFGRSNEEATKWIEKIRESSQEKAAMFGTGTQEEDDNPNKPGPQDGTGVNPMKKGSETGLKNFHSETNKEADDTDAT